MRLVKLTDNWGSVCLGTAKVTADRNGNIVSETDFGNGTIKYRFKCIGARKQVTRKDGYTMWKKQRLWVTCDKNSPFAKAVSELNYGDTVYIYGILSSSTYTDNNSGKQRKTLFCNVEYLQVIAKVDGDPKPDSIEMESEDEFDEFDDF